MSILIVGTLAIDSLETPFAKKENALGGSATYIALAASYFIPGENITLVSVVGEDFPTHGWNLLKERKFDTSGVEIVKGGKTFFWSGKYHYDMNTRDTLVTDLNVLATFQPKVPAHAASHEFVVLGNLTPGVQSSVIDQLTKKPKLIICDTMNFWITGMRKELEATLERSNALVLNDSEARLLVESPSLIYCGRKLQEMLSADGPRIVIIKKGEHGALLFYNEKFFSAPSFPLEEIFDPTGAGDTFMGGFTGYLAKRNSTDYEDVKRAVIYGTALASYCCTKFSTEAIENLKMEEIYKRFLELQSLSAFDDEPG
jgi:sugar/nucleoside kinase (ribokinase family)